VGVASEDRIHRALSPQPLLTLDGRRARALSPCAAVATPSPGERPTRASRHACSAGERGERFRPAWIPPAQERRKGEEGAEWSRLASFELGMEGAGLGTTTRDAGGGGLRGSGHRAPQSLAKREEATVAWIRPGRMRQGGSRTRRRGGEQGRATYRLRTPPLGRSTQAGEGPGDSPCVWFTGRRERGGGGWRCHACGEEGGLIARAWELDFYFQSFARQLMKGFKGVS